VPEARLKETVDTKLAELDLTQFANKKAGSLSGGNKRKLVVACALIGNPLLIFLDEVRRRLWGWLSVVSG
jgi:ABC-type multidrug transport system ATPase subunit